MRPARIWFDAPGVRWRMVGMLVLIATVALTLFVSYQRELWTAQEVVVAVAPRLAASAAAASAPRRVAYVAPAASLPVLPRAPVAAPRRACGPGAAPSDALAAEEVSSAALDRRARDTGARWIAAMQTSGDERIRAAGWLIGLASDGAGLRDRLATLAASSRDPLVQAYALRACRGAGATSSACQTLAPQAWAQVETDNAAAWLAVAGDPRAEAAAQLDALQQAARATRYDTHAAALHLLIQAAPPPGIDDLDRLAMGRQVAAARADWLGTEPLRLHCSAAQLTDPARVPICDRLAELLATRGQTVPDLLQAREIGQRVGWPDERLDALRDETDAMVAFEGRAGELTDCAALARQSAFYADVGRLGQVGALRQAMQRAAR